MKTLLLLLTLLTPARIEADDTPPAPVGVIILQAIPEHEAAVVEFVSIQWVDRYNGYVVDQAGAKTPFMTQAIGRIIYFDQTYYEELDNNENWIEWRYGIRSREYVILPIRSISLRPSDAPRLASDQAVLEDTAGRYPISAQILAPMIATLKDENAKLSSGLVMQDGAWVQEKDAVSTIANSVPVVGDAETLVTFTTKDGKRFENAKVTVNDSGVSVLTDDGGASVSFDRLPDDLSAFPKTTKDKIVDTKKKYERAQVVAAAAASAAAAPPPPPPSFLDSISFYFHQVVDWFRSLVGSSAAPAPAGNSSTNAPPAPAPPAATTAPTIDVPQPASMVAAMVNGHLTSADGSAATLRPGTQYFALYYSAQWCPPCHAFTPRLVTWYDGFKPSHPNFELVFVSEDHDEDSMFSYMKEMSMPWPAVRFGALRHDGNPPFKGSGIESYAGNGIPDLVLVSADGAVLSDSYRNGTYVSPDLVIDDINRIVGGANSGSGPVAQ